MPIQISVFWIDYCPAIVIASVFMVIVTLRRNYESHKPFSLFIIATNFATSVMMGMACAYFASDGFEIIYKSPTPDLFIYIGAIGGALMSYSGFNFLVSRLVALFDRIIDVLFRRYGG